MESLGGSATSISFSTAVFGPRVVDVEVPKKDILRLSLRSVNDREELGDDGG